MRSRPGAIPGRILVDASAYFALAAADDVHHHRAVAVIDARRGRLFTTNFVVAETHALMVSRLGRAIARRFLDEIDASATVVVRVSAVDERRARAIIRAHADKDYTLTDATSFAVMERLRIGEAFTFDRHFAQYGFAVLGQDNV